MGVVSRVLKDFSALDALVKYGFRDAKTNSAHEARRMTGRCTVVLYRSGKLVIQGKDEHVGPIESIIFGDKSAKKNTDDSETVRIGGDECLKGDTFGGIVVCCVKADRNARRQLFSLGVADSKRIADAKIMKMALQALKVLGKNASVKEFYPVEYNRMYQKYGSVTRMLNDMYLKAITDVGDADECVIDQYPGCRIAGCRSVEKGESKYIEIAAASVIARQRGLLQIESLSKMTGFEVPKGSTHVSWALERLRREKRKFNDFVKMHFRNVESFHGDG